MLFRGSVNIKTLDLMCLDAATPCNSHAIDEAGSQLLFKPRADSAVQASLLLQCSTALLARTWAVMSSRMLKHLFSSNKPGAASMADTEVRAGMHFLRFSAVKLVSKSA